MFTSRAEFRLLLRHDNADRRLTPLGREIGLVDDQRWQRFQAYNEELRSGQEQLNSIRCDGLLLAEWLRRPEVTWDQLLAMSPEFAARPLSPRAAEQLSIEVKYAGYIRRQEAEIAKADKVQAVRIPADFDYQRIPQLRREAKEKLARVQPGDLGQAGRISGITPADLSILLLYLKDRKRLAT
jgi:tRNA uridine 5-carboxymethylaminomethyl modification enzyme